MYIKLWIFVLFDLQHTILFTWIVNNVNFNYTTKYKYKLLRSYFSNKYYLCTAIIKVNFHS